ncbi:ribonuclease P protein component [Muricoccus aerilatus]|uniref:ribonuclease P protein component n=1 Tax=Muricoccus aerilatus TaxID=452982 RepID=UPI000A01E18D|nr:ribonuclease P protein component [Roseomonas aerilata]
MKLPRMKKRRDFLRAAQRGKRAARPGMVIQALPGTGGPLRLGFTVTKKVGNAVVRNRTKRRLREAARLVLGAEPPAGWDVVLIGRDETRGRPFTQLQGDLRGALRQVGVMPGNAASAPPGAAP